MVAWVQPTCHRLRTHNHTDMTALRTRHVRSAALQVQKSLALAFCGAMKKHMRQELEAHAQLGAGATAEQASEDLLAALQVSRQFEGFLTAQIEGGRVAGGGDTDVHAARLRLLSYVSDQRDRDPDSEPALFKVRGRRRSSGALHSSLL